MNGIVVIKRKGIFVGIKYYLFLMTTFYNLIYKNQILLNSGYSRYDQHHYIVHTADTIYSIVDYIYSLIF